MCASRDYGSCRISRRPILPVADGTPLSPNERSSITGTSTTTLLFKPLIAAVSAMDAACTSIPSAANPPPRSSHHPHPPFREDCWTEDATRTLIRAWGDHYLDLNRGNLRQKHWQEVADAVNAHHGHAKKLRRTDIQCKNRIDTLKKKFKIEKSRVLDSNGVFRSQWPFYSSLDSLIGSTTSSTSSKKFLPPINRKQMPISVIPLPASVPVGPRSKRPISVSNNHNVAADAQFRRCLTSTAMVVAAPEQEESGSESRLSWRSHGDGEKDGYKELAEAIERLGDVYERVEEAKQRQIVEMEKQRMEFAKELEFQRMQLFVDTQVQLEKLKRCKRSC